MSGRYSWAANMTPPNDPPSRIARAATYARSVHRARSHETAHEEGPAPDAKIPEHPLIPRGPAELIVSQPKLLELIEHLRSAGSFAYDSEFIGELTYHPKLCLVQVASSKRVSLIDPLVEEIDLAPFWELIADPAIEKIVHAGAQDVEPVVRHLGKPPANVLDAQIAAGFVGMAYPVALSKLVLELAGAKLGKGLTFTHWDQRPLSNMQLRYAADDVRYLPAIRAALGERLKALGHEQWAVQECAAMCDPRQYQFDPDTYYHRVRGSGSLHPQGLAILRELTIWRDTAARLHNVPPRALLKDEVMMDLSRSPVKTVEKLARVRGLPRPVEAQHGAELVAATLRAIALPASKIPHVRHYEPSPTERFRTDALWAAAQAICAGQSIDPNLVTNQREIGELYRHTLAEKPAEHLSLLTGWRRAALGEPLLELMLGKRSVALNWSEGSLRTSA
jgi:ribonuclease D